jgi:UDP-N-acetylglucosamine 1-carboxyvinyltransferase
MLAVCLVNRGKTTLHGMPKVEEVFRYIEILESLGVSVKWLGESTLEIIPPQKTRQQKSVTIS